MEYRQLKYMLTVAEERSFTKAAQKLYIAQPSLSQYIQKIEQTIGVQLFDRSTNPLTLTYAGEVFAQTASRILELMNQLDTQMQEFIDFKKGRITLGISSARSSILLPKILPVFHDKYPGVEVVIKEGAISEIEDLALRGLTDLSVTFLPLKSPNLRYVPLLTEKVILVVPKGHRLANKKSTKIRLIDLKEENFVMLKATRNIRQLIDPLFVEAGFQPKIIFESENPGTVFSFVASKMGITFGSSILQYFNLFSSELVYLEIESSPPSRTMAIVYHEDRYLSKAAFEFINLTKELFSK